MAEDDWCLRSQAAALWPYHGRTDMAIHRGVQNSMGLYKGSWCFQTTETIWINLRTMLQVAFFFSPLSASFNHCLPTWGVPPPLSPDSIAQGFVSSQHRSSENWFCHFWWYGLGPPPRPGSQWISHLCIFYEGANTNPSQPSRNSTVTGWGGYPYGLQEDNLPGIRGAKERCSNKAETS